MRPLRTVIRAMEQLLQAQHVKLTSDAAVQIRSCLVWAMDLERFGCTRSDLGELRNGILGVCGVVRQSLAEVRRADEFDVVAHVFAAASNLPRLRASCESPA